VQSVGSQRTLAAMTEAQFDEWLAACSAINHRPNIANSAHDAKGTPPTRSLQSISAAQQKPANARASSTARRRERKHPDPPAQRVRK